MIKPYYKDDAVTIYHGDCREIVPTLGRFDSVITDPPYAIMGGGASIAGKGTEEAFDLQFYEAWFREILSVLHPAMEDHGAMWWTSDWRGAVAAERALCSVGGYQKKMRLAAIGVWDRGGLGMGHVLRKTYECFCVAVMPEWKRIATDCPDVWRLKWTPADRDNGHCAEKPTELFSRAMALLGSKTILDPFAGSGTTGRAAKDLGRKAVLIEREERYCEIAARRMGQEVFNF